MTKVILNSFKFKPVHIKHTRNTSNSNKVSKLVYCVCIKENNEFKAYVNVPSELEFPDTLVISFTEGSYALKGKTNIFTRVPDKNGHYTRIIRTKHHAIHFPNISEIYTPFRERFVYSGWIIKNNEHYEFDMNDIVDYYENVDYLVPNIKLNVNTNVICK